MTRAGAFSVRWRDHCLVKAREAPSVVSRPNRGVSCCWYRPVMSVRNWIGDHSGMSQFGI